MTHTIAFRLWMRIAPIVQSGAHSSVLASACGCVQVSSTGVGVVHRDQAVELTSVRACVQASEKDRRVLESIRHAAYGYRIRIAYRRSPWCVQVRYMNRASGFSFACWRGEAVSVCHGHGQVGMQA
jgi:hypothetical protein